MTEQKTQTKPEVEPVIKPGPSEDPEVKFPDLAVVEINTMQDAVQAYLQERIDEKELRSLLGKFGFVPGQLFTPGERIDAAFRRKLPDDLYFPSPNPFDDVDRRSKAVAEKEKAREDASKAAEKDNKDK